MFLFRSHGLTFGTVQPGGFDNCPIDLNSQLYRHFLVTNNTSRLSPFAPRVSQTLFLQSPAPPSVAKIEPMYLKVVWMIFLLRPASPARLRSKLVDPLKLSQTWIAYSSQYSTQNIQGAPSVCPPPSFFH